MTFSLFFQSIINGLNLGATYALIALGYTMVYGIIRMINFAHGDFIMIGAYTLFYTIPLMVNAGMPAWLAVIAAIVVCAIVGVLVEIFAYRPVRKAGPMSALITALAMSIFLQNLANQKISYAKYDTDYVAKYKEEGTVLDVTVKGIVNAGVIAYVEGVRGFIPASKLSLSYVEDLNEYLNKPLQVQVIDVNEEKKRLVLSARELLRAKAEEEKKAKVSNVEVGLVTEGTVESLQPYGAFVNLGDGLSGLVHISQISAKRIKHPSAVLNVGDKVKVKVIAIKDGKLSLSMKALNDVAAEEIHEETVELPKSEELTTNLGSLFANIKLDQ